MSHTYTLIRKMYSIDECSVLMGQFVSGLKHIFIGKNEKEKGNSSAVNKSLFRKVKDQIRP